MDDSVTYQATIARGRREELTEIDQLERLGVRLLDAASWQQLLKLPSSPRRRREQTR